MSSEVCKGFKAKTRKEVVKDVEHRIKDGESKLSVFSTYSMTEWEDVATKRLATLVAVSHRRRWKWLNNTLVAVYIPLVLMNIFAVVMAVASGSSLEMAGGLIGGAIGVGINFVILIGLLRYNVLAHYLLFVFALNGLGKCLEPASKGDVGAVINLVLLLISMALAAVLFRKLLPNTSILFKPKRDGWGKPVFED